MSVTVLSSSDKSNIRKCIDVIYICIVSDTSTFVILRLKSVLVKSIVAIKNNLQN